MEDCTGKWFAGPNPEQYPIGPCDTKEEAIRQFKEDDPDWGEPITGVAKAVYCSINADSLIDDIGEQMYDELYEDALEYWCNNVSQKQKEVLSERLTKVFHDWLDEVGEDKCWNVIEERN